MGQKTANRYLEDIQTALTLLQEKPDLLRPKPNVSPKFKFYRVREHFLVCVELKDFLLVLTIKHGHRELESDKMVSWKVYAQVPPRVEYSSTPHARDLEPILDSLCAWARNIKRPWENRKRASAGKTFLQTR